jgi:alkylation response protein AidB-like acyl-CoA dehydrogenase
LGQVAKIAATDLVDLVAAQIDLARFELTTDARDAVGRAGRLALFVPPVVMGYGFGMAAIASALSRYWGWTAALALVSGFQLLAGGLGLLLSLRRLSAASALARTARDTADNVRRTIAAVSPSPRSSRV